MNFFLDPCIPATPGFVLADCDWKILGAKKIALFRGIESGM